MRNTHTTAKCQRLTSEQQKFAENNHNLIYKFLQKHNLDRNAWYDVAAIGYCQAVLAYDGENSKFGHYAFICMLNAVRNTMRNEGTKSRRAELPCLSLSHNTNSGDGLFRKSELEEVLNVETSDMVGDLNAELFISKARKLLKGIKLEIFELLLSGYSEREIAKKLKCSSQNVSSHVVEMRKKLRRYIE